MWVRHVAWRPRRLLTVGLAAIAWLAASLTPAAGEDNWLVGRLLVASPELTGPTFNQTIIYMIHHDETGAYGVVINAPMGEVPLDRLLEQFTPEAPGDQPSEDAPKSNADEAAVLKVYFGGPVRRQAASLLHSSDVMLPDSELIDDGIAFTRDPELLRLIAKGEGPKDSIFTLGYAGWAPGQLEGELQRGSWYVITWSKAMIFDPDVETKWDRAVAQGAPEL